MDTKQVIARFEAERQALALLEHPNIAHVYDAGTTRVGRPYFVMEYVKGVPITEHCDLEKLAIEERLGLFLQVCEAVQHAHQKGIIHRDIKPSNVQVAIHGDQAVPKIIDFGVAKAISQPLTERTLVTEQGQFVGTPEYMSPEQAEMTGQDIDTRTDIYSLGVVLYELLTGTLPFDPKTLRQGGVDHIRHMIREEDPKTPSTRLSTISGAESTKVAQLRRTDVRTLGRKLHGDLDWITIKAMEKDRMRRYQTAHALAEDVQRHVSHEPVLAGPPSKMYRMKKFLRKHRTQTIAAAMTVVLLACVVLVFVMYLRGVKRVRESEFLEHTNILSKAMELRSNGQFQAALAKVETIVNSEHVGPTAHLLRARLVLELQGPADAVKELQKLLNERDEIACQAHFLLARIYLESDPGDPDTTQQYQQKAREHQQKGEKLFLESAEAYFNRSMMASTVNRTLEWLNKAIDLDPGHYDSREARALAYYALNNYGKMEQDVEAVIVMRPKDSLGYALRAIARREKAIEQAESELLGQAIRDHNRAIEISPDDPELYNQRRRTHMQMGNYQQVLSDARECVQLQPDENIYHFHVFCALVALGRYDEAKVKYDSIVESGLMSKRRLDLSAAKYVADTLDAGLSWYPTERRPEGAAFLAMHESHEIYHQLAKKAKRVVTQGFHATWSPDGTELAYSRGILGFTGIEIVNLKRGKTRLLTVPGMDSAWSPDGRYIAFTRYRRNLLLTELTAERAEQDPSLREREIWIIKADGTEEPRLLARGYWPCWSSDSKRIFYHSLLDNVLYSISIEKSAKPTPIVQHTSLFSTMSPDGKYVAHRNRDGRIVELATNSIVADCSMPLGAGGGFVNWSPDGRELCIGGDGLWIYDLDKKKASKVLSGSFGWCSWSQTDIRQMAIDRQYSRLHQAIWVARLDPNVSTTEALGPGRTIEEHCQEMIGYYTRRIDADPEDAESHLSRAECYIYLQEYEKATADFEELAILLESGDLPEQLTSLAIVAITDLAVGGMEKYGMGAYEQALATLTGVDKLHGAINYESNPADIAFMAMSLHRLGRDQEAQAVLNRLRGLFEDGRNTHKLSYLCKAEQLFAGENSKVYLVWGCIEAGKLEEASQRVEELRSLPPQEYTDIAVSIARATRALAGAYYERGRSANYSSGEYGEAIGDYEAAVHADPNYTQAFSDLAWLRAACPETDLRDKVKAIENATKACELTDWKDHRYVGTLAAVHAEVGDFATAIKWQKEATDLLTEDNRNSWQPIYESRLKLYQSGKPCQEGNLWSFSTGGMIGWWKFDEGRGNIVLDWSGHGNHGSLQGDPQWVDGIIGGALDLDGSDFVTIDGVVDDITSNNITLSLWLKTTRNDAEVIACNSSGRGNVVRLAIDNSKAAVDEAAPAGHSTTSVDDDQWHFVTYTRSGTTGYIYVDAIQENTCPAGFNFSASDLWSIGQEWDRSGPSDFLTGTVDDARIYSYALSEAEIKALYANKGSGPTED
jgi:tetratricopeptide (TPR) repeat protein